jgi:hypothetical protein
VREAKQRKEKDGEKGEAAHRTPLVHGKWAAWAKGALALEAGAMRE